MLVESNSWKILNVKWRYLDIILHIMEEALKGFKLEADIIVVVFLED